QHDFGARDPGESKRRQRVELHTGLTISVELKGRFRDRRDARESPLFLGGRMKSERLKPLHSSPAFVFQPRRRPIAAPDSALEFRQIPVECINDLGHHHAFPADAATSSDSTHPYPRSSSSRASSFPPDLTMRPFVSTCTTSGTM